MSVDVSIEIRLSKEVSSEEVDEYFIQSPNYCGIYLPTRKYLEAFVHDWKLDHIAHMKEVCPSMTDEEAYRKLKYDDEKLYDRFSKYVVMVDVQHLTRNTDGKIVSAGYVMHESCRLNGGDLLLSPALISRFFPNARVECELSFDGDDPMLYVYKGGECVEEKQLWDENEHESGHESDVSFSEEENALRRKAALEAL